MDEEVEEMLEEKAEEIVDQSSENLDEEVVLNRLREKVLEKESVSRRGFLKAFGLGAGATALSSLASADIFKVTSTTKTSRVNADEVDGHDILADQLSSRPSAGESGRLFYATDGQGVYYDNGSDWLQVSAKLYAKELTTDVSLNGGSLKVTVFEDTDQDGEAENTEEINLDDGTNTYRLDNFLGGSGNDYWFEVEFSDENIDISATVNKVKLSGVGVWETSSDWDNAVDETGVAHENVSNTDNTDGTVVKEGYSYQKPDLVNGLVGWWPLTDETAQDYSGSGNDGTVNGPTTGVAGRGGIQAMSFDGTDDQINTDNNIFANGTDFTLSVWIYPRNVSNNQQIYLEEVNATDNPAVSMSIANSGSGLIECGFSDSGTTVRDSASISANNWYHYVSTWDSSSQTLTQYLNGTVPTSQGGGANFEGVTFPPIIGSARPGGKNNIDAVISDVRVYNRTLSSSEVQTLYEWGNIDVARPAGPNDGGVSYYSFNSSNANDQWGTNDGTVSGATYVSNGGPRNDGAYDFDGSNDYIDFGSIDFQSLGTFSQSVWVNVDSTGSNAFYVNNGGASNTNTAIYENGSAGEIQFYLQTDSETVRPFFPVSELTTDVWYNFVQTWDGSTVKSYVNGELVDTETTSSSTLASTSGPYVAGARDDGSGATDGTIDEIRVYNRALTPSEVHKLYQYGTLGRDMRDLLVRA
jgi:hypothetical protein